MSSPYRPVDCATHSEYELAIMRHQWLQLNWQDAAGETHHERLRPLDLCTAADGEYLIAETDAGEPRRLRLDHIHQRQVIPESGRREKQP